MNAPYQFLNYTKQTLKFVLLYFDPGDPDNGGDEDCVQYLNSLTDYNWDDAVCTYRQLAFCQYE